MTDADRAISAARRLAGSGAPPRMAALAAAAGTSRATLYRLFGSREELLRRAGIEPDRDAAERVLEAAQALCAERGVQAFTFEELAEAAGLSRATVYRLFPGRAPLLRALILRYSPLEPATAALERLRDRPPAEVMPELARVAAEAAAGHRGLLMSLASEAARLDPDVMETLRYGVGRIGAVLVPYVQRQIAARRLRDLHPALLVQAFMGPLFLHVASRPLLEAGGLQMPPLEEVAAEFAHGWVRAYSGEAA